MADEKDITGELIPPPPGSADATPGPKEGAPAGSDATVDRSVTPPVLPPTPAPHQKTQPPPPIPYLERIRALNYYEVLDIAHDSTFDQINTAYKAALQMLSPQSVAIYSILSADEAAAMSTLVETAFRVLRDPVERRKYDKDIGRAGAFAAADAPPAIIAGEALLPVQRAFSFAASAFIIEQIDSRPPADAFKTSIDPAPGTLDLPRSEKTASQPPEPAVDAPPAVADAPAAMPREVRADFKPTPVVEPFEPAAAPPPTSPAPAAEDATVDRPSSRPPSKPPRQARPANTDDVPTMPPTAAQEASLKEPVAVPPVTALPDLKPEEEAFFAPPPPAPAPESSVEPMLEPPPPPAAAARPPSNPPAPAAVELPEPEEPVIGPRTMYSGPKLRKIRELSGLDLRDIAAITRITYTNLKNIEDEVYRELPALVYTRGYLIQYAKCLKLDAKRVASTYIERMIAVVGDVE